MRRITATWNSDATMRVKPGRCARSPYSPERANRRIVTRTASGRQVVRARPRELEVRLRPDDELDLERGEDREEDSDRVERAERDHACEAARRVELEDAREQQGPPGAHVARGVQVRGGARRPYFLELSYKSVSHAGPITLHQQMNPSNVPGDSS